MSALDHVTRAIRESAEGARNPTVNNHVYWLAKLDQAPDREAAESEIVRAAMEAGLPEREARDTFRRAWRDGERLRGISLVSATPASRPAPVRPPHAEVAALLDACVRASDDREVSAWLESRGLDADDVSRRDLVRALPRGVEVPSWARRWHWSGHRAIMPLVGADGVTRSVRARSVRGAPPKAQSPAGCELRGLVLADVRGVDLLRGEPWAIASAASRGLAIAEGEPDYLALAADRPVCDRASPAVLGIVAGSWTDEIAARIPDGARVTVLCDDDPTGRRYSDQICAALASRCVVMRPEVAHEAV